VINNVDDSLLISLAFTCDQQHSIVRPAVCLLIVHPFVLHGNSRYEQISKYFLSLSVTVFCYSGQSEIVQVICGINILFVCTQLSFLDI